MSRSASTVRRFWDQAGMLIVFALFFATCALSIDNFLSWFNAKSLLLAVSTIGIVACTMLFCLASGAFDLSVGSVVACSGIVAAMVANATDSAVLGISAGLALGAVVGLLNGALVARVGMNALIATLATMQIVRGTGHALTKSNSVGVVNETLANLGYVAFPSEALWLKLGVSEDLAPQLQVPLTIWICLACFVGFGLLLERTTFGRNTLAIGGNMEAARLAGVPVARVRIAIFTLQGVFAALAGIVLAARLQLGDPKVAQGLELDVIAACVLGGVSLAGGVGRMSHVIAGVLIMGTMRNAMNLLGIRSEYQYIASGVILLAAAGLDLLKQRRKN